MLIKLKLAVEKYNFKLQTDNLTVNELYQKVYAKLKDTKYNEGGKILQNEDSFALVFGGKEISKQTQGNLKDIIGPDILHGHHRIYVLPIYNIKKADQLRKFQRTIQNQIRSEGKYLPPEERERSQGNPYDLAYKLSEIASKMEYTIGVKSISLVVKESLGKYGPSFEKEPTYFQEALNYLNKIKAQQPNNLDQRFFQNDNKPKSSPPKKTGQSDDYRPDYNLT